VNQGSKVKTNKLSQIFTESVIKGETDYTVLQSMVLGIMIWL